MTETEKLQKIFNELKKINGDKIHPKDRYDFCISVVANLGINNRSEESLFLDPDFVDELVDEWKYGSKEKEEIKPSLDTGSFWW